MPPLARADCRAAIDKQQVFGHLNFPSLNVVIIHQIIECEPELAPEILKRLGAAAAEVAQRCDLDRIRLGVAGDVELQPTRQILALERKALVPIDQRMRHVAVESAQIGIEAVNPMAGRSIYSSL